tara:strand:- start:9 stop:527 length:519 start_codon:yes stop_codon:yes gene_type:complete
MKELVEFVKTSSEDLPDIYCDMDGVLVDFITGANIAVGGTFATIEKNKRWNMVQQSKGFWPNLDWMPGSKRLYDFIIRYDAHILSAFSGRDPASKSGKLKWLKKRTNFKKANIHLVSRSQKQAYAKNKDGKSNVLIDDYEKNIIEWEKKGGIGIHHTNVGKTISELKRLGFK